MENNAKIGVPQAKYLVFTSAGDTANLHYWLQGERNFDVWITYYGDHTNRLRNVADFYNARKGGKFPNLHYVYTHWKEILAHYEAIMVMDDDIIIHGSDISKLFAIRQQYDLWILQPAFSPAGKVSHAITRVRPWAFMRYTNFVELTCPLFRKDKLDTFMAIYNPVLVGWGIDWWFLDVLGPQLENRVAIVDAIPCINPHDVDKGGRREIDGLQTFSERKRIWEAVRQQYNIQSIARGKEEYKVVYTKFFHRFLSLYGVHVRPRLHRYLPAPLRAVS
ncbi:MAG: hypothetical protein AB7N91_16675 [Candidatus Tectimicrobiota bacterium]